MISEREQKSTHERLRWRSSVGECEAAEAQKRSNGPDQEGGPPRISEVGRYWTFHGDGLTDAVDPFETLGTRSTAGAYWQPSHFQRARLTRYHALSQA